MPPAIPIATYRLQLSAHFDFDAAAVVVPPPGAEPATRHGPSAAPSGAPGVPGTRRDHDGEQVELRRIILQR